MFRNKNKINLVLFFLSCYYIYMIPNNLKYQSKVESAPARRYRTNIQPQNGMGTSSSGYGANSTIIINIPTRNNTALIPSESVLKGSVTFTLGGTAAVALALEACGHHAWIQRLRVFHGSNLLQDIQNYSEIAKILYDYQMPLDATQGRFSVTSGTANDYTGSVISATPANLVANGIVVKPVNRGKQYIPQADSATPTLAANSVVTDNFSINLISLVGSLAGGKYLPLWEMTSAPLRVELVVQPSIVNAMCIAPSGATPTNGAFNLFNVEFIGEFLELPDSAINAIQSGSSNPLQMVFPDWRAYTYSQLLGTSQTTVSMPIPAKFSSLKSIVVNSKITTGQATFYPAGSQNFNLNSYTFRIGSEVLPSSAPTTTSDFFNEACKCFGSLADMGYQPSIDVDAYTVAYNQSAIDTYIENITSNSGAFLVGIDLESYQNADKSAVFAGMNTNTSDIFFMPVHNGLVAGTQCYYTAFANFDSVLVCENGVAYVRF
jgi:hypothetical protein